MKGTIKIISYQQEYELNKVKKYFKLIFFKKILKLN
jgi:hypothetical protein